MIGRHKNDDIISGPVIHIKFAIITPWIFCPVETKRYHLINFTGTKFNNFTIFFVISKGINSAAAKKVEL